MDLWTRLAALPMGLVLACIGAIIVLVVGCWSLLCADRKRLEARVGTSPAGPIDRSLEELAALLERHEEAVEEWEHELPAIIRAALTLAREENK